MTTPKWAREDEQVELVCWRGPLSALATRLRLEAGEVKRLRAICRTAKPGFLVADVPLRNSELVLSALRRRLTPSSEVVPGGVDGQLTDRMMGLY